MAETLDTLGGKIDALTKRFDGVDKRLDGVDKRLDQVQSTLGVKIDAVEALAKLAVERLDDVLKKDVGNSLAHARLDARIDDHDLRILALEGRQPRT